MKKLKNWAAFSPNAPPLKNLDLPQVYDMVYQPWLHPGLLLSPYHHARPYLLLSATQTYQFYHFAAILGHLCIIWYIYFVIDAINPVC